MSAELTVTDGIAELRLCQEPCNEIGTDMLLALEHALDAIEGALRNEPDGLRALIVHSTERGFCAGAHLRQLEAAIRGQGPDVYGPDLAAFLERIHAVMDRLDMLPITTVGAIHGACFGGGFELALTLDILIADRSARFCFPELRLGIIPGFGGIPRLKRELPNGVVRDLLLTGRSVGARRAAELGLVSQVTVVGEALAAARSCAGQAALFLPAARATAKRFIKPLPSAELQEEKRLFLEMFRDPAVAAALRAFVARRDPMPYQPLALEGGP